jgi:hypothetical protein
MASAVLVLLNKKPECHATCITVKKGAKNFIRKMSFTALQKGTEGKT